jgi:hypothetical protein
MLLAGPDLGEGGAVFDSGARPGPAFTLFIVDFFDTSAFQFLIAACEALEPGRRRGAYNTPICSRTRFK